jgi:phosphohistidine phosphatase
MKLYLVQHGNAVAKKVDADRPLSQKGRQDVENLADFIRPLGLYVDCLWHSGKTRAAQTTEILAEVVKTNKGPIQHDGLGPTDDVSKLRNQLIDRQQDTMIVGHLPFLSKLTSLLITGSESASTVTFQQGCIVCIECCDENQWQLAWMITPQLLG